MALVADARQVTRALIPHGQGILRIGNRAGHRKGWPPSGGALGAPVPGESSGTCPPGGTAGARCSSRGCGVQPRCAGHPGRPHWWRRKPEPARSGERPGWVGRAPGAIRSQAAAPPVSAAIFSPGTSGPARFRYPVCCRVAVHPRSSMGVSEEFDATHRFPRVSGCAARRVGHPRRRGRTGLFALGAAPCTARGSSVTRNLPSLGPHRGGAGRVLRDGRLLQAVV